MDRTTHLATATTAVLVGLPLLAFAWNRLWGASRLPYPPGPKGHPILANLRDFPKNRWFETFSAWQARYGDLIYLKVIGKRYLVINGLDVANELLVRRGNRHSGRQDLVMITHVIGRDWNFITAQPGPFHSACRTIFRRAIGQNEVAAYDDLIIQECNDLLEALNGFEGDPWPLIHSAVGAIVIKVAYGNSIYQQHGKEMVELNYKMLRMVTSVAYQFWVVNFIKWLHYLPDWLPLAFKKVGKTGKKLQERMHYWAWGETVKHFEAGIAEKSIALEYLERQEDLDTVRDALAMMYSAGVDNTAKTILIFLSTLLLHPGVQRKAQEELSQELTSGFPSSGDDRLKLPYLDAAWRESRRLNPSSPLGIQHMALQEDEYNGMYIPKGTILIANMGFMCRDPRIFDEPEEYKPERWLPQYNPKASTLPDDIVFGFGRRVCPGQYLAERVGFIFSAAILGRYSILPMPGEKIPERYVFQDAVIRGPINFRCRFESHAT